MCVACSLARLAGDQELSRTDRARIVIGFMVALSAVNATSITAGIIVHDEKDVDAVSKRMAAAMGNIHPFQIGAFMAPVAAMMTCIAEREHSLFMETMIPHPIATIMGKNLNATGCGDTMNCLRDIATGAITDPNVIFNTAAAADLLATDGAVKSDHKS